MGTISEGSKRLDTTLSSEAFASKDSVFLLVKNHILKSSLAEDDPKDKLGDMHVDGVAQHWSSKISTFLDDLRSSSAKLTGKLKPTDETGGHSREWKLKDETERYRVMYREGPEGTPFHTLCLDGIVDGDFASAMCVAWEAPLFREWWPQFVVPTFRISESKWLRRVRVGQDLSLLRLKVPWPVAPREVVMSAFEVEYLQEDLIVGLVDSVPAGTTEINEEIHGFSAADLPPPSSSNVRMDVAGGFVMQRTSKDQFFFRTIMTMDMKLEFVPPWMINFIARQVAGQGLKLYQKAVTAATKGTGSGKAFQKPLKTGNMYNRLRSSLEAKTTANGDLHIRESGKAKSLQGSLRKMGSSEYTRVVPYPVKADETEGSAVGSGALAIDDTHPERQESRAVQEVKPEGRVIQEMKSDIAGSSSTQGVQPSSKAVMDEAVREYDDPEVVWAISILDKMISYTRSCAAEKATTSQPSVESISLGRRETDLNETLLKDSVRKPHPPPAKTRNCDTVVVEQAAATSNALQKSDNMESSRSRGQQSAGGDAESASLSGFWSASEIEVSSSQDDSDTDVGASGSSIAGLPKDQGLEVETERRRRKWRWTCFSPTISNKRVEHGRSNLYGQDIRRGSERHLKSLMGDPNRRGYHTDGDEKYIQTRRLQSEGHPSDRSVTLGELLLDDQH